MFDPSPVSAQSDIGDRTAAASAALETALGAGGVSRRRADRMHHGRGEGVPDVGLPDIVVWPESTRDVAAVARICSEHRLPMVPFGAGSSLEGQVAALHGGVSIDMTRMNRLIAVSQESLDCHVEAGITRLTLDDQLRDTGLFFPLDPGANATLGGMAAHAGLWYERRWVWDHA